MSASERGAAKGAAARAARLGATLCAAALLAGCGALRGPLDLPETPPVESGAWPRLADAPEFASPD
ncbi:MAG: hypothetical protein AAGI51_17580, partial [Pseudomonadota bacterium]